MIEYFCIGLACIPSLIGMTLCVLGEKRRRAREAAQATAAFISDTHFCKAVRARPLEDIERLRQLSEIVDSVIAWRAAKRKARGR